MMMAMECRVMSCTRPHRSSPADLVRDPPPPPEATATSTASFLDTTSQAQPCHGSDQGPWLPEPEARLIKKWNRKS